MRVGRPGRVVRRFVLSLVVFALAGAAVVMAVVAVAGARSSGPELSCHAAAGGGPVCVGEVR